MSSTTVITVIDVDRIDALNQHHHAAEQAYTGALEHVIAAGRLLIDIKAELSHGQWGSWLAENFDGSDRTARVYMQLAGAPQITNRQSSADLASVSIAAALREVTRPAPRPQPRDAINAVSVMEDDDEPMGLLPGKIDAARDRLQADTRTLGWDDAHHQRRRAHILAMLDEARTKLDRCAQGDLAPQQIADLLHEAAIEARKACAQLDNLAFEFE